MEHFENYHPKYFVIFQKKKISDLSHLLTLKLEKAGIQIFVNQCHHDNFFC